MELKSKYLKTKKDLKPIFTNQKSFYKKAYTISNSLQQFNNMGLCLYDGLQRVTLFSYDTFIIQLDFTNNTITYSDYWSYSKTTIKHVKEFIQQWIGFFNKNNIIFKDFSKKEIEKTLKEYREKEIEKTLREYGIRKGE